MTTEQYMQALNRLADLLETPEPGMPIQPEGLKLHTSVEMPDGDYGVWLPAGMDYPPASMDMTDGSAPELPAGYEWALSPYGSMAGWGITRAEPLERRTPKPQKPAPASDGIAKGTRQTPDAAAGSDDV